MMLLVVVSMSIHGSEWAVCRASDYYSRSAAGSQDRYRDRQPDRHHSEKVKAAPLAQVYAFISPTWELLSCELFNVGA